MKIPGRDPNLPFVCLLLRRLQEHEFERVGALVAIRADVRVIAARNRDCSRNSAGKFRKRFSDCSTAVCIPDRDSSLLEKEVRQPPLLLETLRSLCANSWQRTLKRENTRRWNGIASVYPGGKIREMQNVIERSVMCVKREFFGG